MDEPAVTLLREHPGKPCNPTVNNYGPRPNLNPGTPKYWAVLLITAL